MNMFRKSSIFQSYYSLISNHGRIPFVSALISNFNPIIVLFLTQDKNEMYQTVNLFQSYYSLISNTTICTE